MNSLQVNFDSYLTEIRNKEANQIELSTLNRTVLKQANTQQKQLSVVHVLSQFESHGLNDLNAAKLMNRVDSKFILPITFLPEILDQLKNHYSVLEIDSNRVSSYQNKYFDTQAMTLYNNHHNGKLNRYKVRRRRYVETNTEFLEVKLKNNKKRTIKKRIKLSEQTNEEERCADFIDQQLLTTINNITSDNLALSQQSGYKRIALANEAAAERLTLDFDLWYQGTDEGKKVKMNGFFIAELKQKKKSKHSPFYQMMSANNFAPKAFSKYCIGCAILYKTSLKSNRFKPILSYIEKLNRIKPLSFSKSI